MTMTNEEIVRDYKQASNKQKQVRILADLNQTSPSEILAILAKEGVEGVKMPERIRPRKPQKTETQLAAPEKAPVRKDAPAGLPDFWKRMEAILDALPEGMSENTLACTQNLLQTLFADYLERRLGKGGRHDA